MRQERKNPKSSWPKLVARKWLNMKNGRNEFPSDYKTNCTHVSKKKEELLG
ncbi:hypothetical protein OROMI_012045 [Orobanche minor]